MATIEKLKRPKIYTESDKILSELSSELNELKARMSTIEEEQEQNREILEELSFQRSLSNELLENQQSEGKEHRENYAVIANVMNSLKSPVSDVVDNLASIISVIDDYETQETLRECMETASTVLESFNEVEEFCIDASGFEQLHQKVVDVRQFFRQIISTVQSSPEFGPYQLRLLVDKNVPTQTALYTDTIERAMKSLLGELKHCLPATKVTITIAIENSAQKYGIDISDLTVQILGEATSQVVWGDSWVESIEQNQDRLLNSGFNLLNARDQLRKAGGHLEIRRRRDNLHGVKFAIPLTY